MKAREERKELEKMLDKSSEKINDNVPNKTEEIPGLKVEPVTDVNFIELREKCEEEANIMLTNAIEFIIPTDMIENNKYLQNKLQVDIISLAGMIYQLRTNEVMQKALIDQINLGMVNARMFEVFAGMTKTIGELNKQLIQTVEAIKQTYKGFVEDVKEKRTESISVSSNSSSGMLTTGEGGVVTRGTKELINNVKKIKRQNIENSEEYIDEAQLIPDISIN